MLLQRSSRLHVLHRLGQRLGHALITGQADPALPVAPREFAHRAENGVVDRPKLGVADGSPACCGAHGYGTVRSHMDDSLLRAWPYLLIMLAVVPLFGLLATGSLSAAWRYTKDWLRIMALMLVVGGVLALIFA